MSLMSKKKPGERFERSNPGYFKLLRQIFLCRLFYFFLIGGMREFSDFVTFEHEVNKVLILHQMKPWREGSGKLHFPHISFFPCFKALLVPEEYLRIADKHFFPLPSPVIEHSRRRYR